MFAAGTSVALAADFTKNDHGITTEADGKKISLQFYTPSTVRVVKNPTDISPSKESLSVVSVPQNVKFNARQSGKYINLSSDSLTVTLDTASGKLSFLTPKGKKLLSEGDNVSFTPVDDAGTPSFRVRQDFTLDADEPIYGFGNLENGQLSQRGLHRTLMPGNIEDGIPVFMSVKGYGVYWDNYSPTTFIDDKTVSYFESEVGDCVDYYFMYGKNADGVIAEMRGLSGAVPMFPLWTYGFWQSRERYKSQEEIVDVVNIDENTGWDRKENAAGDVIADVDFMKPVDTEIYLPAGSSWWDFETNELHKGGKNIVKPTTLKTLPLFIKAGSILPMGPDVQYATEKPWDELEIRIYLGADGEFTLYEDEFDNYNYEKGAYSTIRFSWNDRTRTLTIADRQGEYPGMLAKRKFNVVMCGKNSQKSPVSVAYTGSKTEVKL